MDDSKLIELVRQHQSLYNPKHHLYKDANVRDNIWAQIASLIRQPVEECKNRWKNVRDTFMRRKRTQKLPTGSARPRKLRKWHLEEHLVFLCQVDSERETFSNIEAQEASDANVDCESQQTENIGMEGDVDKAESEVTGSLTETIGINDGKVDENIGDQTLYRKSPELHTTYKPKKSKKNSADNLVEIFRKNSDERAKFLSTVLAKQPEERDPIDTFFKSMAMSVKKLSEKNQVPAKMQICQVVAELELEEISSRSQSLSGSTSSVFSDLQTPTPTPNAYSSHISGLDNEQEQLITSLLSKDFK